MVTKTNRRRFFKIKKREAINQRAREMRTGKVNEGLRIDERRGENMEEKTVKIVQINSFFSLFSSITRDSRIIALSLFRTHRWQ